MLEIFDNLCILLSKAEQKHYQHTKRLLEKNDLGITPGQLAVLYTLYKGDGILISELSKKIYLDNSTLTGLIDRMEKSELVARCNVPADRRSYNISLTAKGRALEPAIKEITTQVQATMLQSCSPEEITAFRKVLLKIFESL